ncbi:MAG: hypothetical protein GF317_08330 [Candidatus Lokiarchaeota archaeon]|nr:hypothetical protein [Candidatus Lokiarchaeota archaeon]MBD3199718.1 hypothetical protein [Candidatus Lokiarchaeota archaeon]
MESFPKLTGLSLDYNRFAKIENIAPPFGFFKPELSYNRIKEVVSETPLLVGDDLILDHIL